MTTGAIPQGGAGVAEAKLVGEVRVVRMAADACGGLVIVLSHGNTQSVVRHTILIVTASAVQCAAGGGAGGWVRHADAALPTAEATLYGSLVTINAVTAIGRDVIIGEPVIWAGRAMANGALCGDGGVWCC